MPVGRMGFLNDLLRIKLYVLFNIVTFGGLMLMGDRYVGGTEQVVRSFIEK
jgi:hypothetical protein